MLLARMAEAAYWAGRYLERAEDMARIVQVHGETLIDLPVGADVGWAPLVDIAGMRSAYEDHYGPLGTRAEGTGTGPVASASEARVISFVLTDRSNPSSILASVAGARTDLRLARPVVPREVWELCNDLWLTLVADAPFVVQRDVRVGWLRRVVHECQRITGVVQGTMRRDEALAFLRMGQQLERAELTCRFLAVRADSVVPAAGRAPYDEVHRMALLRSLASYQPFRRAAAARPDAGATLRFLLQDEAFPRAVCACLSELREAAKTLPGNEEVLAACTDAAVVVAGAPVAQVTEDGLGAFLAELAPAVRAVHSRVAALYFGAEAAPSPDPGPRVQVRPSAPEPGGPGRITAVPAERVYRVTHRTTYDYDGPVDQSYNEAHLRPRDSGHQRCVAHELEVEPAPASMSQYRDLFGNTVATFVVQGGFLHMVVLSTSEVLVQAPPVPPSGPPWESVRTLLDIDRQADARDARRCRAASRLVPTSPALADYALASFPPGRPFVEAVHHLSARIHDDFVYEPGFTSITTPLLEVFAARRGVCQDFAHLAVGCLRSLGLSARYVSGYVETHPPGTERLVGADASHAWASAFLPGWGWVDVDPTNDTLVDQAYVTTAWGRDYWDVSPLRGSVEGGGNAHRLDVAVDVARVEVARPA
ncbi:MAG TPA: alpha-E domain-containing protein [Acidimicrobiales bacterium]|nr:alpha-E domain-containing protein [Acidimicrobiales bacterium]